jgi:hypothetical protein
MATYQESARELPAREVDVVIAGGGTGGPVAALAAARRGARTTLIEAKGYLGGIAVEGGTALHSFYNLWTAFPDVEKRHVVRGIPQEIVDRLAEAGGTTGHVEMIEGRDYDSICTAIDTEIYKRVLFDMLEEAGVDICVNTFLAGAIVEQGDGAGHHIRGVLAESRSGREAIYARSFIDATGYGDLAAHAGASFTEPNDYPVANSVGLGNVSLEGFYDFLTAHNALAEFARGPRSGKPGQIVRLRGNMDKLPAGFRDGAREIGMATTTTTIHDDYMMFIKLNYQMPVSPTDRDAVAAAEAELRRRQARAVELFRQYVPGCERAFIARTSPSLCIRRGRLIACDYDITLDDVLEGRHFADDVMVYGFHDSAPRLQIKEGRTYGIPYRALLPVGVDNLYVTGMMITSDHDAHMSTRNTVSCMAQGQAAGTAAALCATGAIPQGGYASRELPYDVLRQALEEDGVYFET